MELKFISYDGRYPNLCSGNLILELDGVRQYFPQCCLSSGGGAYFDADGDDHVTSGDWDITDWPEGFPDSMKKTAVQLVNDNVRQGCCGGCL